MQAGRVRQSMQDSNWTVPNLLTVCRILLTPAFVLAFMSGRHTLAWILFAAAGITDALDGLLARLLHQRSRLGAILDPLADKLLLDTAFICLALEGWVARWLAVLVVSRDVIIIGGAAVLHYFGADPKGGVRPSWLGKLTTNAQIFLILFVMLEYALDFKAPGWRTALAVLAAAFTVSSGLHYILMGLKRFPSDQTN